MLWFDGRLVESPVAFDLADRGLLLGDGVFDTALAIDGCIAFEQAHVGRLVDAAGMLGFTIKPEQVVEAMRAVALAAPYAVIRTTLTRGVGPRGLTPPLTARPLLFASAAPMRPGLAFASMRLQVGRIRRNETSPASRLKTLGYLDAVLSARDAAAAGFDETLFLNTAGRVACAGIGNLFAVSGRTLLTPPPEEGVLPGIVRALVISLAPELGFDVALRPVSLDDILHAEAVLLTNSLRLVSPVTAVGAHSLPSADDPLFHALSRALRNAVATSCGVVMKALP